MKLLLRLQCRHAAAPHMNDAIHTLKSSFLPPVNKHWRDSPQQSKVSGAFVNKKI